jgi:hypothetical protein
MSEEIIQTTTPVESSVTAQPTNVVTETPKTDFNTLSTKDQGDIFEKAFIKKEPVAEKKEPVVTTPPTVEKEPTATEATPAPVVEKEVPYTPEEIATTGLDKLDPARLPEALKPYYKSMLADYTKKTMAVAEQKRQVEQPAPVQQQPKTMDRLRQERMQDVSAVEQIINEGNTGEKVDFNEWDADHQYVMKRVSDYRVYNENQQNSVKATNERVIQREMSIPEYPNIMEQAKKELVSLAGSSLDGLNMANRIMEADNRLGRRQASQEDIELLQTFWDNSKTKYKASKIPKPATPVTPAKPVVASESTGSSIPTESKTKRFNPKDAAKLDSKGLADLMGIFATGGNKK